VGLLTGLDAATLREIVPLQEGLETNFIIFYRKSMDLFLLRHGIAEEPSNFRGEDCDRPLTGEGVDKMQREAQAMRLFLEESLVILSSPFVRALETAKIVAAAMPKATLAEVPELALGGSVTRILEQVACLQEVSQVMVVGHEPELVEIVAVLTGIRAEAIQVKKGSLTSLRLVRFEPRPRATLRWHLAPKQLLALSKVVDAS